MNKMKLPEEEKEFISISFSEEIIPVNMIPAIPSKIPGTNLYSDFSNTTYILLIGIILCLVFTILILSK